MTVQQLQIDLKRTILNSRLLMYLVIGGIASGIDIGLFLILNLGLGTSAMVAHLISVPVSAIYSFVCNAWLNFKKTDKILLRAISFGIVVFLGYVLGIVVIWLVETYTDFGGTVGKFVSLPLVVAFQYFLNSRVSFRG